MIYTYPNITTTTNGNTISGTWITSVTTATTCPTYYYYDPGVITQTVELRTGHSKPKEEEIDFDRTKELDDFLDNFPII